MSGMSLSSIDALALNSVNEDGNTPLMQAISDGNVDRAVELLKNPLVDLSMVQNLGDDSSHSDSDSDTEKKEVSAAPWMGAFLHCVAFQSAENGFAWVLHLIRSSRPETYLNLFNQKMSDGQTPLSLSFYAWFDAKRNGEIEKAKNARRFFLTLLEFGAEPLEAKLMKIFDMGFSSVESFAIKAPSVSFSSAKTRWASGIRKIKSLNLAVSAFRASILFGADFSSEVNEGVARADSLEYSSDSE